MPEDKAILNTDLDLNSRQFLSRSKKKESYVLDREPRYMNYNRN